MSKLPRSALLKDPNEPDKPADKHIAVEDQAEYDRDRDYPNEDDNESSGNFFKFEHLPTSCRKRVMTS